MFQHTDRFQELRSMQFYSKYFTPLPQRNQEMSKADLIQKNSVQQPHLAVVSGYV